MMHDRDIGTHPKTGTIKSCAQMDETKKKTSTNTACSSAQIPKIQIQI